MGLDLAGKLIDLQAPVHDPNFSQNVKIILKDLPLNEVTNERVLMTLKSLDSVDVQSPVCYSNIFVNGQRTHLRNGDWFVYVTEQSVPKLVKSLIIEDFPTRVIKLVIYSRCSCCQNSWTQSKLRGLSSLCSSRSLRFNSSLQRGADPLLNLHVCPEECTWVTADTVYDSVEKELQHNKVQSHSLEHEANALLALATPMEIMYQSRDLIPQDSEAWQKQEIMAMEFSCRNKFNNYSHARHALLQARSELVEGTSNMKWGLGLDIQRTKEYHPDYWPGDNHMGKILSKIRKDFEAEWQVTEDEDLSSKCKLNSLENDHASK